MCLWIRGGRANGDAANHVCFEEGHARLRRLVRHMPSLCSILRLCHSTGVCMCSLKMNKNLLELTSDLVSFLPSSKAIPPDPGLIIAWGVAPNVLHNCSIKPYPKPCLFYPLASTAAIQQPGLVQKAQQYFPSHALSLSCPPKVLWHTKAGREFLL